MKPDRSLKEEIEEETNQITDRIAELRKEREEEARKFEIRGQERLRNNHFGLDNITSLSRRYLRGLN